MKTLKFRPYLVNQILKGEKTSTWRLFDDKNLSKNDKISLLNWVTKKEFAKGIIIETKEKPLEKLTAEDWEGHEKYSSNEEMYKEYQKYYPDKTVNESTIVKIIKFKLI